MVRKEIELERLPVESESLAVKSIVYGEFIPETNDLSYFFETINNIKQHIKNDSLKTRYFNFPTFNEFLRIISIKEEKNPMFYSKTNTLLSSAEGFFEGKSLGLDHDYVHVIIHGLSLVEFLEDIDRNTFGIGLDEKNFERFLGKNIIYLNNPVFSYKIIRNLGLEGFFTEKTTYITPIVDFENFEMIHIARIGCVVALKQFLDYKSFREGEEYSLEKLLYEIRGKDISNKSLNISGLNKIYRDSKGNIEVNMLRFLHLKYNYNSLELDYFPLRKSILIPRIFYNGGNNGF